MKITSVVFFFLAKAEALEAFSQIVWQLLQDVQERLVFRAHLYLQTDILQYSPAPGDLAYPEKLEMMEVIMCNFCNLTFIFDLVFLKCVHKVVSTIVLSKN